ncbi:GNAT family N-acetyltransferase [Piscibacillus halophilus]|uniref:N-acetylglutamate synthase, GNAT family n=1 Tax=Piscibacillus halophilus TaxID=571933 RepID=A0A1H9JRY4_9BACI|nr:GNAT family N-acetyltransferase [Piscibacillus halophilus]SEQ89335.1 N-acetylglutamate synthase, GNAT family [Piscibacillus halophilus]
MEIRAFKSSDEVGWVRCRTLSFLDTAYFDNVLNKKETYENPAIELVAIDDGKVVGLLDIEYEEKEKTVCTRGRGLGGMIWHIATHPDVQRKGIGSKLLEKAESICREKGIEYLEAWTRDDEWVNHWYARNDFEKVYTYLHVYLEGKEEVDSSIKAQDSNLKVLQAFAHYTGDQMDEVISKFNRVHECHCYEKRISN